MTASVDKHHLELTHGGFAALLGAAADAIVIIDSHGIVLNFNQAAERLFGYRANEVEQKNVSILMPQPFRSEHDKYISRYITSGIPRIIGAGRRVEAQKKDSTIFPVELSVGEYSVDGNPYFIGIIHDLTERERVENSLRDSRQQAQEAHERLAHGDRISTMGEMASGIAHEINQPLTAISSYVEASRRRLESEPIDRRKLGELLEKTEQQAKRAGEIVHRIRSLIRSHDIQMECIDINRIVSDAVDLARVDASSRGLVVDLELMADSCEVIADSVQIQQVIINLVRNAIDATEEAQPHGGRIVVGTKEIVMDDNVEVWVRDFGAGIPEVIRDHLFEPFVTSKATGIGMGLSISRSIVNAHGGKLWTDHMEPGTIFCFTLPAAVADDE
jgi:two-component system sensor kinase FixL